MPSIATNALKLQLLCVLLFASSCGNNQRRLGGDSSVDGAADTPIAGFIDTDRDRLPDALEIGDDTNEPRDSNSDGVPDYLDPDCDDDTILDGDESFNDADSDDTPNYLDVDSDSDMISDLLEAGDSDLLTSPVDTDTDGTPDYLDPDSDDDGLSDQRETAAGTDPRRADSDGDSVNDLIEVAAGTDPLRMEDSPRTRGDFVFVVPYELAPDPSSDTLDFATTVRSADIYFLMDTTISMGNSVISLRDNIRDFIPQVRAVVPDAYFGIGDYRDYPAGPNGGLYGNPGDFAYRNHTAITNSMTALEAGLAQYEVYGGGDPPESLVPALYAIATGNALPGSSGLSTAANCPATTTGYPCFRSNAVPIVVIITDNTTHNGPLGANNYNNSELGGLSPTYDSAISALNLANINIIGIGQGDRGEAHMRAIGTATGSVDPLGQPFYSTWSGTAPIGNTVLEQIQALAASTRFDVSVRFLDDPSDAVDTYAAFVDRLMPNEAGNPARGCAARAATDTNGDGLVDTFLGVRGQRVCFDVFPKENTVVMPSRVPQLFRATIQVVGDGFTVLDERDVYFLVPPQVEIGLD